MYNPKNPVLNLYSVAKSVATIGKGVVLGLLYLGVVGKWI